MKQMKIGNQWKAIAAMLILTFVLLLNGYNQNVVDVNIYYTNIWNGPYQTYEPHLSFPKGEYTFSTAGTGKMVLCNAQGDVFATGNGGEVFNITLDKDETDMFVCSDGELITSVHFEKDGWIFKDVIVITVLLVGFLSCLLYKYNRKQEFSEKDLIAFLLIGLAILVSYPLYTSTILYGHDINFHLYRIEGIKDGLLAGQFPVRIHPTHNSEYGYITASVYPELFLYIPAILRVMGVSLITSYHVFLFCMNLLTAVCMYIAAKGISGSKYVGCLASIVYTLSTWRVINLYYRAAIGEALAMTFFPLLFYGLYNILKGNYKKWWVLTFACTGIFMSHIISTMIAAIVSVGFFAIYFKSLFDMKRLWALVKAGITTVLLNAWFLMAFFVYYVGLDLFIKHKPENTEYYQNAIFPAQLFNLFGADFGTSNLLSRGIVGEMSLTLGIGVTFCLVIAVGYYLFGKKEKKQNSFLNTMLLASVCLIFMSTTLFPWGLLQQKKIINMFCGTMQFPWRFLSIASGMIVIVGISNLEQMIGNLKNKKISLAIGAFICVLAFVYWGNAFTSTSSPVVRTGTAVSTSGSIGWDNEYFKTGTNLSLFDENLYTTSEEVEVVSYDKSGTNVALELSGAMDGSWVEVPLLNFPGYKAVDDSGNDLEVVDGNNNVVRVMLTENSSQVNVSYGSLWYLRVAEVISILTLGVILTIYFKNKNRN